MGLDLDYILDMTLSAGTKGLPAEGEGLKLRDVGLQGWNLLDGTIPLPACVMRSSALSANMAAFGHYLERAGVRLAPHGKTTMSPQLFSRQIEAGAWGMTVATYAQARVAIACGIRNLLIANELVGEAEIRSLAAQNDAMEDLTLLSLVDSVAGAERLNACLDRAGARRPLEVLVELGISGGRTGARGLASALEVAECVTASPHLRLRGVEGYEGLLVTGDARADAVRVDAFLDDLLALFTACRQRGLITGEPVISAGGSAYFDLVARGLSSRDALPLLRSGCYITHDTGFYNALLRHVGDRAVLGPAPNLTSALEVWAQVLSRPEPDLVLIGAGRRDVADDGGAPKVEAWFRPGATARPVPVTDWTFFRMNDQHGYLRVPAAADIAVGDYVALSISHPCTTFDKWPLLLEVDDDYRVTGALKTFF